MNVRNWWKRYLFRKKVLFNKISCGHVEKRFDFSTEVEEIRRKSKFDLWRGKVNNKNFFIKVFLWTRRRFFWQHLKTFRWISGKKQCFSKKLAFIKVFLWPFTLEIWQHCWNYFAKSRSIFAQCPKMIKTNHNLLFFQAKTYFIELFLWTRRIELWKTCWFSFAH